MPWVQGKSLGGCGAAHPGVPHGLAGIGPSLRRGLQLGSAERFGGTADIFGVLPAGASPCRLAWRELCGGDPRPAGGAHPSPCVRPDRLRWAASRGKRSHPESHV